MNETYEETGGVDHLQDIEKPAIYSKRAIWGFSIFITPLFGGILLMQNLAAIDKKSRRIGYLLFH